MVISIDDIDILYHGYLHAFWDFWCQPVSAARLPALGPTVTGKIHSGQIHKGDKISCNLAGKNASTNSRCYMTLYILYDAIENNERNK
jgi:hypothetical protein